MVALRKGTKLIDNPKDFMLRVRLDQELLKKLDKCCVKTGKTRSGIVRDGIEEQYQKMKK